MRLKNSEGTLLMKQFVKKWYRKWIVSLFVALPLSFVVLFFGLMPPRFDVVMYFDNIVGEGGCYSYLSDSNTFFSYLYQGEAYFGSELKTLRLTDLAFNVEQVELYLYDVEEADLLSYDIVMFGRVVTHLNIDGLTHPFSASRRTAYESNEGVMAHIVIPDETDLITVGFPGNTIIPIGVWIAYALFILLIALLLSVGLAVLIDRAPSVTLPLLSASCLMTAMIMGCYLCGSLPYVSYPFFLLNWLFFFAAALLINSLTLPWIGTVFVSVFTLIWYVANYFIILFRNKPIMPSDLKAIGTAKEVAGGYDLTPTGPMIVSVLVLALWLTLICLVYRKTRPKEKPPMKKRLIRRGVGAAVAALLVLLGVNTSTYDNLNNFMWDARLLNAFHQQGILLTYIKAVELSQVKMPEGYSREAVASILDEYQPETDSGAVHPTRIIMIMNEAFSDLRTVGLDPNIDVMPFIDSLDQNTVEGRLYVSITGGGTCNTEFEALTGNTLAFLNPGAYPYTENVTEPLFSLASYFRDNGYVTEAFHSHFATNWRRDVVYPYLGFERFNSFEKYPTFENETTLRGYATDIMDYTVIRQRDAANEGSPRFFFDVTVQNHGDFEHFKELKQADELVPYEDSLHQSVRVYLSLIKLSDDTLQEFMEQYQNSAEPTMIIFFGDHQPSLREEAMNQVYTTMSGNLETFQTKFFIWTNYETETVHDAAISANYLPWLILERGNFPLPPYVQLLREVHEKYPILSAQGVVDAYGNVYDNVAVLLDDPLLRKYQYVQYANLFDELDPAWFQVK